MFPASTTPVSAKDRADPLESQELGRTHPAPIAPSDFGVEIGGSPEFDELPGIHRFGDKLARKLCAGCYEHRALFKYRKRVRADRQHRLCFRCYRSGMDRLRSIVMQEARQ